MAGLRISSLLQFAFSRHSKDSGPEQTIFTIRRISAVHKGQYCTAPRQAAKFRKPLELLLTEQDFHFVTRRKGKPPLLHQSIRDQVLRWGGRELASWIQRRFGQGGYMKKIVGVVL